MWKTLTKHGNWVPQTRFSLSRYHPSFYSPVGGGARLYREAKPKIFLNLVEVTQLKSAVTFLWYSIIGGKKKRLIHCSYHHGLTHHCLRTWAVFPLPTAKWHMSVRMNWTTASSQTAESQAAHALWALGANPNTSFVWWECEVVIRKQTQVWHKALPPGRWAALSALHSNSSSISQNPRVASLTHQWF